MNNQTVDITPTPRVLSILGDIPFSTWQCIAELMDNSLDAFASAQRKGCVLTTPMVTVSWSKDNVPISDREIVFQDNGTGMDLATLQNAARAGFSSNDPVHNLGLFGMGFNIATAKLGDETLFLSATKASASWIGIKINFDELQKAGTFQAPVVTVSKQDPAESGTMIVVRKLKEGILTELSKRSTLIRKRLEKVYTPILSLRNVSIVIQGKELSPQPLCVWGESRFVVRKNRQISAIQKIDIDLGEMYFDESRNRYLTEDEYDYIDEDRKAYIIKRPRRLIGWLGVQRFCDPSDFGIDFIRNGRKILVGDKSLFQFENPETGTPIIEYPIELGTTMGGRIVGELNVDYLIPTYQKNGFNTTDSSWALTREAIRGAGPFLPKNREMLAYPGANESPLGLLVNGFRRLDKGTKNLSIDNTVAKDFYKEFQKGNAAYQSDEKWYKAAQEHDREEGGTTTPVNGGNAPSDNPDDYAPTASIGTGDNVAGLGENGGRRDSSSTDSSAAYSELPPVKATSTRNDLILHSSKNESLSKKYVYDIKQGGFNVTAYQVVNSQIKENGVRRPCAVFQDGVELDFFYDPSHSLLAEYPITTKQILLMELAERFAMRDGGASPLNVYFGLISSYMEDERINAEVLRNRATSILQTIRDAIPNLIAHKVAEAKYILQQESSEEEACINKLLASAPHLVESYKNIDADAPRAFAFIPDVTIARFVKELPELFLDGNVFSQPYSSIDFANIEMTTRLRRSSVAIVTAYLSDAAALLSGGSQMGKQELIRYCKSLDLLEGLTQ